MIQILENCNSYKTKEYLAGDLSFPQEHEYISTTDANIGLGSYAEFTWEPPHYHTMCTEYQYVIKGRTKIYDLSEDVEYEFSEGDFFVISPGTRYSPKIAAGTQVLFIKIPAVNDKVLIEAEKLETWDSSWDAQVSI